jgi:predicted RNA methylase
MELSNVLSEKNLFNWDAFGVPENNIYQIRKSNLDALKFIDLFAGIGGFRLAGESLGMECVFSSEIDTFAKEVYQSNFNDYPSGDITKIQPCDIPDFDVLFAGFPCQPFSYAGQLKGFADTARGTLFFNIVRIIEEKQTKNIANEIRLQQKKCNEKIFLHCYSSNNI